MPTCLQISTQISLTNTVNKAQKDYNSADVAEGIHIRLLIMPRAHHECYLSQ